MRRLAIVCLVAVSLGAGACRRLTWDDLKKHEVLREAYWGEFAARPLVDRVRTVAPPEVLDYGAKINELQGYKEKPRVAALSADFEAEVRQAVAELPARVAELVSARVAAIILVNDLGSSAFAEQLQDTKTYGTSFLLLDAGLLDRPANDWASWREATPFSDDPALRLVATVAPPDQDTRRISVEFMLLHELAHIIAFTRELHPGYKPPDEGTVDKYAYTRLSWRVGGKAYLSLFDDAFVGRDSVRYYADPPAKLPLLRALDLYAALGKTNLPTLYGAKDPLEDFAEGFATYVHTVILKRPWQVQLLKNNQPVMTYRACWDEPRCATKRAILEGLLGQP